MSPSKPLLLIAAILAAYPAIAQTTSAAPAASAASAAAAANADSPQAIESVIVTARRIAERLQDVPLSIVALTGKDLEERGITSLVDLSLLTPGLSYSTDFGRTGERPVVRGISVTRLDAPQPVSVFIDGVYVRDGVLSLGIDDAQRIEVIKGPQSALYGRATYAGAINYVTVKPGNVLSGKVTTTVAEDGERAVFGALTVPLVNDMLSMRVRLKHSEFGGQYTNSVDGSKLGTENSDSGGVKFALRLSENFDASLSLDTARSRDGMFVTVVRPIPLQAGGKVTNQNGSSNVANGSECNGHLINLVGTDPVTKLPSASFPASPSTIANGWPCGAVSISGTSFPLVATELASYIDPVSGIDYGDVRGSRRSVDRGALTLNYGFGDGYQLTSQTAYTRTATNAGTDQSYGGTALALGTSWLSYTRDKLNYKSQEIRLTSPLDADLTWAVGAFYYKEEADGLTTNLLVQKGAAVVPDTMRLKPASTIENMAPFATVQYQFNKQLRMSFEGRYSSERVQVGGPPQGIAVVTTGPCVAGQPCGITGDRTFTDFAPRVTVDYKLNKETMLYAQVAKGSKAGGFNTLPGLAANYLTFEGERIRATEIGAKSRLLGGRLLVNLALFENDISGLQLSNAITLVNPFTGAFQNDTATVNVGKARTRGLEAEVVYQAAQWLQLSGNYAYTDAKALAGTETTSGSVFGGNMSVAGFTLQRTPKHSLSLSAAMDLPIQGTGLRFVSRADLTYQSRRYADITNTIWADPFTRINVNAGVRGKDWRVVAFVRNATDDATPGNAFRYFNAGTFRRTAVDFPVRMRQFGVTASYDF
ncbi:MAG: TonB-dependent receptor [Rubrivivax sp.]|nr:TonB-dependent receptor [Rubrivivax sp.]MBK7260796.1 TonB-dependent receptor [Rubrivivax sp.]MBK8526471.1 TonB-dependent receptor [Rubrivivax sp.]